MAINIQEILHPSDSNQIKWEKVNYNFDQILANGGGPTGQKGTKGIQGSVGQTGAKGNKGDQGIKGETGATSSRWKVIPRDQDGNGVNEYVILKPKLENDMYHPVVFLGDQTFDNVNSNDGEIQLRSTLTIGKHAVGGDSPSTELLTLWHGPHATTNNNIAITISTDDSGESQYDEDIYSGNWTRFTLDETYGSNLSGQEKIEFKIGMDRVVFDTNVSFDDANSTLKLPATQKAADELELGMIRFFGDNFWGYKKDANGNPGWVQFCMAPCGGGGSTGTIEFEDDSNISVGPDGALLGNTIKIGGGDLDIDVNGDPWSGAPTYTITLNGGSNIMGLSGSGGGLEIPYTTGPTGNLILSEAEFTGPNWVDFSTSDGLAIDATIYTNDNATGRSGTITISHPNDPSVTASITIAQAALTQPTTQAPATTTTTTTGAPTYTDIKIYTVPGDTDVTGGNVDEGTTIKITVTGDNIPDGTLVWVDYTGTHNRDDISGEGSGGGSGSQYNGVLAPLYSSWGNYVQMNGGIGSMSISITADNKLEAESPGDRETFIATLWPTDNSGNTTGELSATVNINDTSYPTIYTVTYSVPGYATQWQACNGTYTEKTATYEAPADGGLATWSTISAAIAENDLHGSGEWYKIISSTEPGFTFGNKIINGAIFTSLAHMSCDSITTTTTLAPLEFTTVATSGTSYATGRSYTWSLSGNPQTGHKIRMSIYSTSIDYTITGTSASELSYDAVGQAYANFLNNVQISTWMQAYGSSAYTQNNPPGFKPTASWDSTNDRLTFNMNWQNSISNPSVIPN